MRIGVVEFVSSIFHQQFVSTLWDAAGGIVYFRPNWCAWGLIFILHVHMFQTPNACITGIVAT